MARFQFQLDKLRRLRETTRDEHRVRLAEAYRAQQILAHQQAAMGSELAESRTAQRAMIAAGSLEVDRVVEQQRYQLAIERGQLNLAEQAATLEGEIERRRSALVDADRQVRLLDKLEARQREEFECKQRAIETALLDETAARRYMERD